MPGYHGMSDLICSMVCHIIQLSLILCRCLLFVDCHVGSNIQVEII